MLSICSLIREAKQSPLLRINCFGGERGGRGGGSALMGCRLAGQALAAEEEEEAKRNKQLKAESL